MTTVVQYQPPFQVLGSRCIPTAIIKHISTTIKNELPSSSLATTPKQPHTQETFQISRMFIDFWGKQSPTVAGQLTHSSSPGVTWSWPPSASRLSSSLSTGMKPSKHWQSWPGGVVFLNIKLWVFFRCSFTHIWTIWNQFWDFQVSISAFSSPRSLPQKDWALTHLHSSTMFHILFPSWVIGELEFKLQKMGSHRYWPTHPQDISRPLWKIGLTLPGRLSRSNHRRVVWTREARPQRQ